MRQTLSTNCCSSDCTTCLCWWYTIFMEAVTGTQKAPPVYECEVETFSSPCKNLSCFEVFHAVQLFEPTTRCSCWRIRKKRSWAWRGKVKLMFVDFMLSLCRFLFVCCKTGNAETMYSLPSPELEPCMRQQWEFEGKFSCRCRKLLSL